MSSKTASFDNYNFSGGNITSNAGAILFSAFLAASQFTVSRLLYYDQKRILMKDQNSLCIFSKISKIRNKLRLCFRNVECASCKKDPKSKNFRSYFIFSSAGARFAQFRL